jgi:hypothetical protein
MITNILKVNAKKKKGKITPTYESITIMCELGISLDETNKFHVCANSFCD